MGCKPSSLAPTQARAPPPTTAGAAPAGYEQPHYVGSVPSAAPGVGQPDPTAAENGGRGTRLRLAALKPDMKALSSPRQSLVSGYEKIKRGASSLKNAMTPATTPGVTPRQDVGGGAREATTALHSIATNAIKEADNPACIDVDEAKRQAVSGPMHTAMAERGETEKEALETEEEAETLEREPQPTPTQLQAVWLLMKINASVTPQKTMRWLHDLEWLLVSLDPLEREQPVYLLLLCCCCSFSYQGDRQKKTGKGASHCVSVLLCLLSLSVASPA